ncbi:MAG: hypothetical protein VX656_20000 [Candidatus Latescibacterota bacterium]|nr:hypothetical protein [Candidatus Latescibacterota bacterium]
MPVDDDQFGHIQQTYRNVSEHAKTLVFWPDDEVEQHGRITLAAKGLQLQFYRASSRGRPANRYR